MNVNKVNQKHLLFLIILLLYLSRGFNFLEWESIFPRRFTLLFILCMFVFMFIYATSKHVRIIKYQHYCLCLLLWPAIPLFSNLLLGGNLITEIAETLGWISVTCLFFLFHKYKFNEQTIVRALTIFAFMELLIQVFEQLFPEYAFFGIDKEVYDATGGTISQKRNDLFRLKIGSAFVPLFVFYYYWSKLWVRKNLLSLFAVVLMLVSIYLYLTRQFLLTLIVTCGIFLIFNIKGRARLFGLAFIVITVTLFSLFWDVLFGSLISDYQSDSYTTDIRFAFIAFVLKYFESHPLLFVFGHGHHDIIYDWYKYGFWVDDIGFLGETLYYGMPWILFYGYLVYSVLIIYRKKVPTYIKLYVFSTLLISLFIFPYRNGLEMFIWICMIYITSLYIDNYSTIYKKK